MGLTENIYPELACLGEESEAQGEDRLAEFLQRVCDMSGQDSRQTHLCLQV